jgi:hypothetical protein
VSTLSANSRMRSQDMPKICNFVSQFYDYSYDNFIRQQAIYLKVSAVRACASTA